MTGPQVGTREPSCCHITRLTIALVGALGELAGKRGGSELGRPEVVLAKALRSL